jgi:hypothetical protein
MSVLGNQYDLGDRQAAYDKFMQGCGSPDCVHAEIDRVKNNFDQPRSMQNYTETGFKKIKCPTKLYNILKYFWDKNRYSNSSENWDVGNTVVNHWESASYMVSVEDSNLLGGGASLQDAIWDAARPTIEEWVGEELKPCSLYGIRIYGNGSILAPHVDRLPLVSSAIINVDQDVDEPWPLEVIGHDGMAYNVTMESGDMVLYESHSLIHGRPFPMKGRFFANIFIHFEPVVKQKSSEDNESELPVYILPGSPSAQEWIARRPQGYEQNDIDASTTEAHLAASAGNLRKLKRIAVKSPEDLTAEDINGWQPIHEAARSGHVEVVQFLLKNGADINTLTGKGTGTSPLYWAIESLGEDHPAVQSLKRLGAILISPDDLEL